jgi:hypothetical protein
MKFTLLHCAARLLRQWVGFVILALSVITAQAQSANSMAEYRVKAAYIYNFTKYVDWPGVQTKEFYVCTAGRDDLGGALFALDRRLAHGLEIRVRQNVAMDQLKDCQIIFVGERDSNLLTVVLRQLNGAPVLVISDTYQAIEGGAHIALASAEDRVEFDVNLAMLQRSNLKVSSQMLKLSRSNRPSKM